MAGILVAGEWLYRAAQMRSHTYEIERRQEIEAKIQQQKAEAEQRERERVEKIRRDKRRQLIAEMLSWQRANDLRACISAARQKAHESGEAKIIERIEQWAAWANAEANEIDPLLRIAQMNEEPIV